MSLNHKAKEVWAIVPFSRPEWFNNVLNNFSRQSFQNKKLVIVENNQAIGYCDSIGFKPDLLLSCDIAHPANAKSTAILKLKEIGAEFFSTFDDDDYYGPEYFEELIENSDRAEVIGKTDIFVKSSNNELKLLASDRENTYCKFINGPTISAWIKDSILFENVGPWAEDICYLEFMNKAGKKIYSTSKYNFLYQRHAGHSHTWKTTDEQIFQTWLNFAEKSRILEIESDYFKDIVNNKKPIEIFKLMKQEEYKKEHSPAYTYVMKQVGSTFDEWVNSIISTVEEK